jgi:hypothetical protein
MFFTIIIDHFHGNKEGFISLSIDDVRTHLIAHLDNWDSQYSEAELAYILEARHGFADEGSKANVEVTITEVQPGERIDL